MRARAWMVWARVRDGLWFLPALLTTAAAVLAGVLTEVDRRGAAAALTERYWIFQGGVEGARGVLSAIAGGLITVTGVVFSVTIVALQLASSQFTPRVLRDFTADRANQAVLGVFIGTFTYALLVLGTVRAQGPGEEPFVPRLAVAGAVVLVLVSIGFLIYFIDHSAASIRVSTILERVTRRTLADVERILPRAGEGAGAREDREPPAPSAPVAGREAGYLRAVDTRALLRLGERHDLVIAVEPRIGHFLLPGEVLGSVSPAAALHEGVARAVREAFAVGSERTPDQDVEFGIVEIADIAVKALSPGINDPTTAARCIDRLSEILLAIGTRPLPGPIRSAAGRARVLLRHPDFERAARLAFGPIGHFGAGNPAIAGKLLETTVRLASLVPPDRRPVLRALHDEVLGAARARAESPLDRAQVEAAAERLGRPGEGA